MMITKKIFFILSMFVCSFVLQGQAVVNPAIQAKLEAFISYSNQKEWDKAFDLMYPKLFTKVPKQDLVDLMVGLESEGIVLQLSNLRITSTSVPVVEGGETFVRVEYTADMVVGVKPGGMYDDLKPILGMTQQFKDTYGAQNVKWSEERKEFQILAHKAMMAIDSDDTGWTLVEINMDQPDLMEYLFSPGIMDALVHVE